MPVRFDDPRAASTALDQPAWPDNSTADGLAGGNAAGIQGWTNQTGCKRGRCQQGHHSRGFSRGSPKWVGLVNGYKLSACLNCKKSFPASSSGRRSLRPEAQRLQARGKGRGCGFCLVFHHAWSSNRSSRTPQPSRNRQGLNWAGPALLLLSSSRFQSVPLRRKTGLDEGRAGLLANNSPVRLGWRPLARPANAVEQSRACPRAMKPGHGGPWPSTAAIRNLSPP